MVCLRMGSNVREDLLVVVTEDPTATRFHIATRELLHQNLPTVLGEVK